MKFKLLLLLTVCLALSVTTHARTITDSVGVENLNGKKLILHKLDPKDNYYSIGRKYGVSPKAIIQFNNNAKMQIGTIVKIPTERSIVETVGTPATQPQRVQTKPAVQQPAVQPAQTQNQPVTQPVTTAPSVQAKPVAQQPAATNTIAQQPVNGNSNGITTQQYKVAAGETLYAIAKRFGTTVEDIAAINKLTSTIVPGQVLQVRSGVPAPPPQPAQNAPSDSLLTKRDSTYVSPDSLSRNIASNRYGLFEKNEKGVATYIDDTSLDPDKKLILHRTAPIGTVIRITNAMNNRTTFAKVVGRFTDTQATKDVIIVMTKNVAQSLGALDKRFHVNISYGTPNE